MKVLLLGEHFSDNLGDDVISECFQNILKKNKVEYVLFDLSGRKEIPNNMGIAKKSVRRSFRKPVLWGHLENILRSKRTIAHNMNLLSNQYDLVIYDGGSIFMDYFAPKLYFINKIISAKKIPIFYYGCGMARLSSNINIAMIKKALNCSSSKQINLRDSLDKFYDTFGMKVNFSPDVALTVSDWKMAGNKTQRIGIGYIFLEDNFNKTYNKTLCDFIQKLENQKIEWELFTNGGIGDYDEMVRFYDDISKKFTIQFGKIKRRPTSIEELIEDITSYRKIVTARLHCSIIAASYGIPTISIGWTEKVYDFYKSIRREEYVIPADYASDDLLELLQKCEIDHETEKVIESNKKEVYRIINKLVN